MCSGFSLAQDSFPRLSEKDIPGLHIVSEKYYDGTSLWGYIDGGADVYLEYGFARLLARNADVNGTRYRIDLYRMNDPESAFGIYSISAFSSMHADSLPPVHCVSRYQLQAACGDYYLSVVNDKGTEEAGRIGAAIGRKLLSQIEPADFALPSLFELETFSPYTGSVKFIRGRLGIENGYPGWEELFSEAARYSVYLMPVRSDSCDIALAHVIFGRKEEADEFALKAGFHTLPIRRIQRREAEGITRCLWRIADTRCVYFEIKTDRRRTDSLIDTIDKFLMR